MNRYFKRMGGWVVLGLGCLLLMQAAQAASFDCAKAGTKVEKIICADAGLSKLDEDLSAAYKAALKDGKQASAIKQAQQQWMQERNGCADAVCVRKTYKTRLLTLQHIPDAAASTTTPNSRTMNAADTELHNPRAHYVLMMSEDDAVCKPILAEYNRNISLDLWPRQKPNPYPWPIPPTLSPTWKVKPWKSLAVDERVLEKAYTLTEADLDGDGKNEVVIRLASWLRSDYRFTSLEIFSLDTVLPDQMKAYEQFFHQNTKADVVPGGYDFPKFKGQASPAELNDFDVIQLNGKQYVTGKTVDMDGIVEVHTEPQWRVISRVRYGRPESPPESRLNWVLDSVCYFKLINSK